MRVKDNYNKKQDREVCLLFFINYKNQTLRLRVKFIVNANYIIYIRES